MTTTESHNMQVPPELSSGTRAVGLGVFTKVLPVVMLKHTSLPTGTACPGARSIRSTLSSLSTALSAFSSGSVIVCLAPSSIFSACVSRRESASKPPASYTARRCSSQRTSLARRIISNIRWSPPLSGWWARESLRNALLICAGVAEWSTPNTA